MQKEFKKNKTELFGYVKESQSHMPCSTSKFSLNKNMNRNIEDNFTTQLLNLH